MAQNGSNPLNLIMYLTAMSEERSLDFLNPYFSASEFKPFPHIQENAQIAHFYLSQKLTTCIFNNTGN
ncbi:hypothetical protein [Pseudoalteromonas sp. MMG024]|uniref:hypothetical protein n=1 Tax=Pseudoalteromonas sp. MMG024 TaxID=2909980 RepID=UPI001F261B19|nr:hypothetical protein [Pseudoalteromonas sp. MMG024]MCF6458063.1 hypothetical protein [Pseudoalteromonas sp. MMG024]